MITYFSELYANFALMLKTYPWLAGAFSLWGLTVLTYLLKYIPAFFNFVKRQVMTTLELNNAGYSGNETQFKSFMKWFLDSPYSKWSRYLSLDGNYSWYDSTNGTDKTYIVGAGYGTHFFIYKRRLFWFTKAALNSQGSEKEKQTIVIKTFGRSQKPILNLIEDFAFKPKVEDVSIYTFSSNNQWQMLTSVKKRPIDSVILNKDLKKELMSNLTYFFNNRDWYQTRGLAYKQTYILHGKPGTGKSSTIKALASHYNKNICIIDLSMMSNTSFESAMSTVPSNSIVLIEDFDSCKALHKRESGEDGVTKTGEETFEFLTLSKILNVMDGVVSLDGTVVFFTTNFIEHIDSAMVRKGRVDYMYEIPYLEDAEIKDYIKLVYPTIQIPDCTFSTIAGCDLQALFMECKENHIEFINRLDKVSEVCDTTVQAA